MRFPTVDELEAGVRAGDRVLLARAITLVESEHPDHERAASELLTRLMPLTSGAYRLGISGTPGVGKSTFIERFGKRRTAAGRRVAVLAIDPSSRVSGGSILGDKTRMQELARDERAFIRPSPTSGTLGGVARKTREAMLVCEAAGFDDVLVETVGVGQSETLVADVVDETLLLVQPGGGDGLQGIKRGIFEAADVVVIHKADVDRPAASAAQAELTSALRLMRGHDVPVLLCSSVSGEGFDELEALLDERHASALASGRQDKRRQTQNVRWMWRLVEDGLMTALRAHVHDASEVESRVREGMLSAREGAGHLLSAVLGASALNPDRSMGTETRGSKSGAPESDSPESDSPECDSLDQGRTKAKDE